MNTYFEEYAREQDLVPVSRDKLDDPRYYKNADALYTSPSPFEVLRALCTYPGIDGPMFDNALVTSDEGTGQVAIEVDDLTRTTYIFGSLD
jgi:hypothetical protein